MKNGLVRTPFRLNREDVFAPMLRELNSFYDSFFNDFNLDLSKSTFPKLDAYTRDDRWVIDVAVPGMSKDDLIVEILPKGNGYKRSIRISGKVSEEYQDHESNIYSVRELRRSQFERIITLPEEVNLDGQEAVLKNGILTLSWPMNQRASPERKLIEIKSE